MSLSLKAELDTWAAALKAYDEQDFEKALNLFSLIGDSSKILTNMGLIYATVGEHQTAVDHFVAAINLDSYLAIAYFQCGVSNFLLGRYDLALLNFEDAYLYLRGNEAINYEQLGLKFKLFSAEIMFNKGLAQLNLGYAEEGMSDMREASKQKVTDEHGVIDEAIRDRGEGYTVFSIPVGILYRPSENKLKNAKSKDYLGKAKLVAASDSNDAFTEFTGARKLQQASGEIINSDEKKLDSDPSVLSRSATAPAPHTDSIVPRPIPLERSKTSLQSTAVVRPDAAIILGSRRSQSVSNPVNVPPESEPPKGNIALGRSNTTRLARTATAGRAAGVGASASKSGGSGAIPPMLRSRPSLPRLQARGAPQVMQQSSSQSLLQTLQPGQYVSAIPTVAPLVLPAAPVQAPGHLTQFYDAYMDAYSDDLASRPAVQQSSPSPSQRRSPASPFYQQPQPRPQQQQQLPAWMQSAPSPSRASSNTSTSSGLSRTPPRATNGSIGPNSGMNQSMGMGMGLSMEPSVGGVNMSKGSIISAGRGTPRRKVTRRPTARKVMMYDEEEGDDGFVAGEYEDVDMASIRVKLHYQGDVRGMTIPPTTSFNEFVERVTTKFGTSLMGLGMKFADEEGTKISLRDESDFELAIETARENAKGRSDGKIEVWCVDV